MKKIFKDLGKILGLGFLALALVIGVGAGSAGATLTLDATSITTTGAFTVTSVAGTTANMFAANTTGDITIGGTGQTSGTTLIYGGTDAGVGTAAGLSLTPGTAGTVVIGAVAGTGAITLGSSTAGQTVNVGTGAVVGSDIVNIGTGTATVRKTVNIATEAISTTNIGTGNFVNTIHIGDHATPVNLITIGGAASSLALADAQWGITSPGVATFVNSLVSASATLGLDVGAAGNLQLGGVNATTIGLGNGSMTALTVTSSTTGTGTVVLPDGAISTAEILDNTVGVADLATSLVFADADNVSFASVSVTAADEGLVLPLHATDCTTANASVIVDGQVCWESDANTLYVGDGDNFIAIPSSLGSANAWTTTNTYTPGTNVSGIALVGTNVTTGTLATVTSSALTTGGALSVTATNTALADTAAGISPVLLAITNAQGTAAQTLGGGFSALRVNFTNAPTFAGNTENMVMIQNQATTNAVDNAVAVGLLIDNADTSATGSTVITDALKITNSGAIAGGITRAINIGSTTVTTDISLQNGETIDNDTDGTIAFGTANLTNSGTVTVTSANASALTVGRLGATTPALQVDASTASSVTGLKITSAAATGGLALAVVGGTNENLTLDAQGSGTVTINATGTGAITLGRATTITTGNLLLSAGTATVTSANASALAVGLNGATNPALQVDASTASSATGLKIKSAAATGGMALSVISSGADEALTIDAKGTGTITLGGTSTGAITLTRAVTASAGVAVTGAVSATTSILAAGPTQGIGYSTGAGGAVTQGTNRTTGVTLNKVTGAITLISAAGSATPASFTVTNSTVGVNDTIIVNQQSGTDLYEIFVTNVAAGSFKITSFTTGGTTTESPVFNFAVIKGVSS